MKFCLLLLITVFCSQSAFSFQTEIIQKACYSNCYLYDNYATENPMKILKDDKYFYVVSSCYIKGNMNDIYFGKFDKNLNLIFETNIGTIANERIRDAILTEDGYFYVVGNYLKDQKGIHGLAQSIMIVKINKNGQELNRALYSGSEASDGSKIIPLSDNKFLIGGRTYSKELGASGSGICSLLIEVDSNLNLVSKSSNLLPIVASTIVGLLPVEDGFIVTGNTFSGGGGANVFVMDEAIDGSGEYNNSEGHNESIYFMKITKDYKIVWKNKLKKSSESPECTSLMQIKDGLYYENFNTDSYIGCSLVDKDGNQKIIRTYGSTNYDLVGSAICFDKYIVLTGYDSPALIVNYMDNELNLIYQDVIAEPDYRIYGSGLLIIDGKLLVAGRKNDLNENESSIFLCLINIIN